MLSAQVAEPETRQTPLLQVNAALPKVGAPLSTNVASTLFADAGAFAEQLALPTVQLTACAAQAGGGGGGGGGGAGQSLSGAGGAGGPGAVRITAIG